MHSVAIEETTSQAFEPASLIQGEQAAGGLHARDEKARKGAGFFDACWTGSVGLFDLFERIRFCFFRFDMMVAGAPHAVAPVGFDALHGQ